MSGQLVLVATPLGNLGDLTPRAVEVLANADVVACEDTRRTGRLLQHAGVPKKRLLVVNEHTEAEQAPEVLKLLAAGHTVALVSDAGTPGISDPGERLVRAAVDAGHGVGVAPGPSAAIAALVVSGLPTGRFVFEGFLPRSGAGRSERLAALSAERRTMVLYEAPHRLGRTLADLVGTLGGDRRVVVARELTKLHEEVWRGTLDEAHRRAREAEPRGEHVLVVAGAPEAAEADDAAVAAALAPLLAAGMSTKEAAARVAAELRIARNRAYTIALRR